MDSLKQFLSLGLSKINEESYLSVELELSERDKEILHAASLIIGGAIAKYVDLEDKRRKLEYHRICAKKAEESELGYVYVAHVENNIYKIGRSYNPEARVKQLGLNPSDIVHIIITHDSAWAERIIHDKLKDKSIKDTTGMSSKFLNKSTWNGGITELFRLNDDDLFSIKSMQSLENEWYTIGVEALNQ